MKTIYLLEGYKGFFKGFNILFARDSTSYGLYFLSYEFLRRKSDEYNIRNEMFYDLVCGGVAG